MQEFDFTVSQEESKNKQRRLAKANLSQAFRIDLRINSRIEQISSLRDLATKATGVLTDMPVAHSGNSSRLEEVVGKIVDLEAEINDETDNLIELKREIMVKIKNVQRPEFQTVLEMRYLCFKSWEEISLSMNYSLNHLHRLHNAALEAFAKIM